MNHLGPARRSVASVTAAACALLASVALTSVALTSAAAPSERPTPAREDADLVVGDGTAASCTSAGVFRAVRRGGRISFACGPDPVTIVMRRTAEVRNTSKRVVIDGGGLVTLSGGGSHRILRQDTCDKSLVWTTSHCNDQATPRLVLKNLTLRDGLVSSGDLEDGSGGAVYARGGRLRIVNSRFLDNRCTGTGPDTGGAAVRVLDQYGDRPVVVRGSVFVGGACSNGGALSSIGVSWQVVDSVFEGNRAIGTGANPARDGTPGGGSGGAIYADGNDFTIHLERVRMERNRANEGGGAIFFVSNDRTGTLSIQSSVLRRNPSLGFENWPGIFFLGQGQPRVTDSVVR